MTENHKHYLWGILFFLGYLLIQLYLMKDYGLSWDYHYHYYAGRYHLGLSVPSINDPSPVPFSPPDPRLTIDDPFGPITQIVPTLSSYIFFETLHILPFDQAYNLPMVIIGSLGVLLIFFILSDLWSKRAAWIGMIFLSLLPVHFGYLHTNMKDVPNAFFFSFTLYLFYKLVEHTTFKRLLYVSLSFALAFNTKINSIFIPIICAIYLFISNLRDFRKLISKKKKIILFFVIAPLFALVLWLPFWRDPIGKLLELPKFYSNNTINMPILFFSNIYHSGVNIPFGYPIVYLFITTPPIILIGFCLGLLVSFFSIVKNKKRHQSIFFLLWFIVPLLRYMSPRAGAIDGVRHFMEVIYPFVILSAVGFSKIINEIKNTRIVSAIILCLFFFLIIPIIHFHPYETSYFNSLIGGVRGAEGKFDIDFWGTPQREAIEWLNENTPTNSFIHIIMAQSSAAVYLRGDLVKNANLKPYEKSDYVVLLNRESFFNLYGIYDYKNDMQRNKKIVYTRQIDNVPLVWIFKN